MVCTQTIQELCHGSLSWKKENDGLLTRQDVTSLKANLLEIRANLLLSGDHFDSCEELCGACVKHMDCDAELQSCSNFGCPRNTS